MADTADASGGRAISRWVPVVRWLPRHQRSWLGPDMIAGFTIWGLLVPEMIAYAGLAGLSPQAGFYTLLATLGLYAIFGTSRQLVVAGTSASAVLVFSAVSGLATSSSSDPATLAAGLIVTTGVLLPSAAPAPADLGCRSSGKSPHCRGRIRTRIAIPRLAAPKGWCWS